LFAIENWVKDYVQKSFHSERASGINLLNGHHPINFFENFKGTYLGTEFYGLEMFFSVEWIPFQ
jgi:hypothetical protein